jgi:hypothetical protein
VPAFKTVEWRNARVTLSWMLALLVVMFAGIVALAHLDGVVPDSHETVLSQLAHRHIRRRAALRITQAATALILVLAANTAFNDFPRCCTCSRATASSRGATCGWATGSRSATG